MVARNFFTSDQDALLVEYYEAYANEGRLDEMARILVRNKTHMATRARELGLTDRKRTKGYLAPGISTRFKKWHSENEHPRGMLGKTHSEKNRDAQSDRSLARWHAMTPEEQREFQNHKSRSWKSGWREIGGRRVYFRSRWEANYARYLEWLRLHGEIAQWEHEPETFWFLKILRGTRSYLPDFRVTENSGIQIYHEVKGWMDDKSRVKLQRMAKYHPHVRLTVIERTAYKSIEKTMKPMLLDWEAGR